MTFFPKRQKSEEEILDEKSYKNLGLLGLIWAGTCHTCKCMVERWDWTAHREYHAKRGEGPTS